MPIGRPELTVALAEVEPRIVERPMLLASFGCRVAALATRSHPSQQAHRGEMLSPFLAHLGDDDHLSAEFASNESGLAIGLTGLCAGFSPEGALERSQRLGRLLQAVLESQFPDFTLRSLEPVGIASAVTSDRVQTKILPSSRRLNGGGRITTLPRPALVGASDREVILPQMNFSADRLAVAVELLRAQGERFTLSLRMRLVRFDAAVLRTLTIARDVAADIDPLSRIEALRQVAEAIPDDVVMTALLDEGSGLTLTPTISSDGELDEPMRRMFCHALFDAEPANAGESAALDLSVTYPRHFVLERVMDGLAISAQHALRRKVPIYSPPKTYGLFLGTSADGSRVLIAEVDRAYHQAITGATGTGKSTFVCNQIVADMNVPRKGLLLLDPHGDLWQTIVELVPESRRDDLVLAHLGDPQHSFTMNVLAGLGGDPAVERSATVNSLLRLFKNSLWPGVPEAFGPMFEMYFTQALLLLMEVQGDQATILDFARVFQDASFRDKLIASCKTKAVVDFWRKTVDNVTHDEISLNNVAPYILSKFTPFTTNQLLAPVLGARSSSLDLQAAIAGGKIVLVNLAKGMVGEGSARLVGALITMRLVAAAQAQMRLPEADRKPFTAYLDEFQTYATEHVAEAIEETRKYRLRLVLACQSLTQIDGRTHRPAIASSIIANVGNLVSFRLGVDDARTLAPWFEPTFRYEDLLYLPNYTAIARLLVDGQAVQPVEFNTRPRPRAD